MLRGVQGSAHGEPEPVLAGLMADDFPLTLQYLLARMRRFPRAGGVVTAIGDGVQRAGFGEVVERIDRLAHALARARRRARRTGRDVRMEHPAPLRVLLRDPLHAAPFCTPSTRACSRARSPT